MTQEEMLELLQAVNVSRPQVTQTLNFHGPIGQQIAHVDKIEAHFDKDMGMQIIGDGGAGAKSCAPDDDEIHMAIAGLYDATDDECNKIFTEQGQWYAVYRVLKEYRNYPEKMTDFVSLIKMNQWATEEPFCKYDSIKAINKSLPLLAVKVTLWHQHKSVNERYAKQCIVAEKLMKLLELI